jgi:hypothetical protein
VDGVRAMRRCFNDVSRFGDLIGGAMNYQEESVAFEGNVILKNAVLRNADTKQACSHCTHAAECDRAFESCNDPGNQRASDEDGSNSRDGKEG